MTKPKKGSLSESIGLKHVEEWRAIAIVVFTFTMLHVRWFTYSSKDSWGYTFAWFLFLSIFCWYCATIVHNSIHVPPFRQKWKNQAWQYSLCLCYGYAVSTLIPGHNLSHHAYTQGPKDVIRTDKMRWSWNFINWVLFIPRVGGAIMEQDTAYVWEMRRRDKPIYYQIRNETIWFVVWQFVYGLSNLEKYIFVIFLPQLMAKVGIISINLYQHDALPTPEEDKFNFSRNFVDPWLNFFTCNNGYHTAHHLSPGTHWSNMKKYHDKNVKPHMNPILDVSSILWFTLSRFVLPGGRLDQHGKQYVLPPEYPDEPWFVPESITDETYSDKSSF